MERSSQIVEQALRALNVNEINKSGDEEGVLQVRLAGTRYIDKSFLYRALDSRDEHAAILLLWLEIEYQLISFIRAYLDDESFNAKETTLTNMLRIFRFEGDISQLTHSFKTLRNEFVHSKSASISRNPSDKIQKHLAIIFRCALVGPLGYAIDFPVIEDGSTLSELEKLVVHGQLAAMFFASANDLYLFNKPQRRVTVRKTEAD